MGENDAQLTRRKPRVLQVIGSMHIGGAENVVMHLMRGLNRDGFDVALYCTKELGVLADELVAESADVRHTASRGRIRRYLTPVFLRRAIASFKPDIVHTHGRTAVLHVGPLALVGGVPTWVHTFHFGGYDKLDRRQLMMERFLCRGATQFVAVSDPQRHSIVRHHDIDADRIVTVLNGVTPNPYTADPRIGAAARAELGLAPDAIVVGTIAVLSEQKGIPYLLEAVRALRATNPRVRCLVVGGGPLEGPLRAHALALGIDGDVVFTGWRKDAARLMSVLDVFVMSSLWEAMPMVLLEAMAARRSIVVTDVGDNRRVVANGHAGVVVPPADPDALARGVAEVVGSPARAAALRDAAYDEYLGRFSVETMLTNYERLYEQVLPR